MNSRFFLLARLGVFAAALLLLAAPAAHAQSSIEVEAGASIAEALTPVAPEYTCMTTDRRFESEQIPVSVEDKTYYGCCHGCVKKLSEHPENRTAVDPVTGNEVDKAEAVIGARPDGKILYFESEASMRRFDPDEHLQSDAPPQDS